VSSFESMLKRSSRVGSFSILKNVRDHGIRSATDAEEVNAIRLACAVMIEEVNAKPRLPRVSPEDLVEGKWYVYDYHSSFIPVVGKAYKTAHGAWAFKCAIDKRYDYPANEYCTIYGPLEFEVSE